MICKHQFVDQSSSPQAALINETNWHVKLPTVGLSSIANRKSHPQAAACHLVSSTLPYSLDL